MIAVLAYLQLLLFNLHVTARVVREQWWRGDGWDQTGLLVHLHALQEAVLCCGVA